MPRLQTVELAPHSTFRREPVDARAAWPLITTLSAPIAPENAPLPVRYGEGAGVGRDVAHGPTPIRTVVNLAIPEWTSIVSPRAVMPRIPGALVVSFPRGHMNPIRERTNIERPASVPQGSKVSLSQQNIGARQGKLAFRI